MWKVFTISIIKAIGLSVHVSASRSGEVKKKTGAGRQSRWHRGAGRPHPTLFNFIKFVTRVSFRVHSDGGFSRHVKKKIVISDPKQNGTPWTYFVKRKHFFGNINKILNRIKTKRSSKLGSFIRFPDLFVFNFFFNHKLMQLKRFEFIIPIWVFFVSNETVTYTDRPDRQTDRSREKRREVRWR